MKKALIFFIATLFLQCSAQNLVQNPSFEIFDICPYSVGQIDFANNWNAGCEYGYSSEYFNSCTLYNSLDNFLIYVITQIGSNTRSANAGLVLFATTSTGERDYRECVSTKLKLKLNNNTCYNVSFYIRFLGYYAVWYSNTLNYASNKVSAYLSADSTIYPTVGFPDLFLLNPQVNYHGEVLNDTSKWVKVQGSFIANGNEQWIHITSFVPDDSVTLYMLPSLAHLIDSSYMPSYYLIDDVSVYPCDAPVYFADAGNDTCIKSGKSVTLGLPERDEYLYWWINGNTGDTISRQSQIVVSPQITTTYILVQKDFKFDETRDTVIVEVGNNCYELQIPEIIIPNIITPNEDGYNDKFMIENSKYYKISVAIYNRWGNLIYESINYQGEWPDKNIADGVYYYTVKYLCSNKEIKNQSGIVNIIK